MSRISFVCTWLTSFNSSYFFVQPCLLQGQNVIYFDVVISEFEPQAKYYVHLGKVWTPNTTKVSKVVEGDPKASFSIATTPRCRGRRYFFSWIAPLYPWSLPYIAECKAASSTIFFQSLVWFDLELNPDLLAHRGTLCSLGQLVMGLNNTTTVLL